MTHVSEPLVAAATAQACGKVILLGEHAVVYGAPALVGGLGRGVTAHVREASGGEGALRFGEPYAPAAREHRPTLDRAWAELLGAPPAVARLDAELAGDLPAGMGLGFSAAAGVALARAVEQYRCGSARPEEVRRRATAWERVFHGNPSGVDVAAAMHGGMLRFSRVTGIEAVPTATELQLAVGLTGLPSATRTMVEQVADLRRRRASWVDDAVERIGRVVEAGIQAACSGDADQLGAAFDDNHQLLRRLGVSTPLLDELCGEARAAGALGAKLTGSGGGGAVIALASAGVATPPGRAEAIVARWRRRGWQAFVTRVGAPASGGDRGELEHG